MAWMGAWVLFVGVASAQVAPEELARDWVAKGIEAAKARDWSRAKDQFQRAYSLHPVPLTLYNLATAQEKVGELVEADRSYRVFLRETSAGEYEAFRKVAAAQRESLRPRLATLTIVAPNLSAGDVIRVGSEELPAAGLGQPLPANPGPVSIVVERSGRVLSALRLDLPEGASRVAELDLPPLLAVAEAPSIPPAELARAAPPPAMAAPPEERGGGLLSSGWFWLATTVVVAGAAGAGLYFGLQDEGYAASLDPVRFPGR